VAAKFCWEASFSLKSGASGASTWQSCARIKRARERYGLLFFRAELAHLELMAHGLFGESVALLYSSSLYAKRRLFCCKDTKIKPNRQINSQNNAYYAMFPFK
jgi:hypothetical protein